MTIDSLEVVFLTTIFILPGFIVNSIVDKTNPPKKYSESIYFLKCLAYSVVNCACWSWLYIIAFRELSKHIYILFLLLVAITIIGATFIAIAISMLKYKDVVGKILRRVKLNPTHSIPSAWDYFFSQLEPSFVVITMIDGNILRGWYSGESFSSSDYEERDIYVENGYKLDDEGNWIFDEESKGFYIPKDQIRCIEFKKGAQIDE